MDVSMPEPDVSFISLSPEPQLGLELARLRENLARAPQADLVLDLACVEIITSPSIGSLLVLRQVLAQHGHRLILCSARLATKCIFRVAGLDSVFEFAANRRDAQKALQRSGVHSS